MPDSMTDQPWCTWVIIGITCIVSFRGFRSYGFEEKYIFNPEAILRGKEFYRLFTSGFLHADTRHLLLNMLTLVLFGRGVELSVGIGEFLAIYLTSIVGGNALSLYVHRHHEYRAYGASGGVCGIIFASILLHPYGAISLYYLPIGIPNWLYALGFLAVSFYGMKEHNRGNIGHDAHLGGAILGFGFTAILHFEYVRYSPRVFVIVLAASVGLLIYLWMNPLFLPVSAFSGLPRLKRTRTAKHSKNTAKPREIDAVLDKISKTGLESLTSDEKALLTEASGKFQRRSESRKPEFDLPI